MKLLQIFLIFLTTSPVWACPERNGFIDLNCDGKIKIAVTGDSIVDGVGDALPGGGYVGRLSRKYPEFTFMNLGFPGITTNRLLAKWKTGFSRQTGRIYRRSQDADVVVIDVGRNDYWKFQPVANSLSNIRRLHTTIRNNLNRYGLPPQVIVADPLPTTRGFQKKFISDLKVGIKRLSNTVFPTVIPFELVNSNYLNPDGLHPGKTGYTQMFKIIDEYFKGELYVSLRQKRTDGDRDGLYDIYEERKFLTDPNLVDTDSDTFSDGDEVFFLNSDPLVPETPTPSASPEVP